MRRKVIAFAVLMMFLWGTALDTSAESVLQRQIQGIQVVVDEEDAGEMIRMLPLGTTESTEAEEEGSSLRMRLAVTASAEGTGSVQQKQSVESVYPAGPGEMIPVLQMLPLENLTLAEAEGAASALQAQSPESPTPAVTETPGSKGIWIRGPEGMKAGTKKYYKVVFGEEKPKKAKVTWSLDCDTKTAQVFRNGQIWVRPGAASGTVLTLKAHVEGKDGNGQPWMAEAAMEIKVK